ncbi:hypothetical protein L6R52_22430 [Myxococcota bacterium]|nr:hypothetical protein [Myxococcota bacterium]
MHWTTVSVLVRASVRSTIALTLGLGLSLAACADRDPVDEELAATLASAIVTARQGFYFYPPLAPAPSPTGVFVQDALASLRVELERTTGGGWVPVATFDARSRPALFLKAYGERYVALIRLSDYFTDRASTYRFRVMLGESQLATADMPTEVWGILDRRPDLVMSLQFRVERTALDRDGDGVPDDLDHCPDFADASNPTPTPEACNGRDDDCSGQADEGNPGGGASCETGRAGVCAAGTMLCAGGQLVCEPDAVASPELCNGLDDDCDGLVDDGFGTTTCGTGACAVTVQSCVAGAPVACVPGAPSAEACNGVDDDCNGIVDDGCLCVHGAVQSCYGGAPGTLNAGVCRAGTQRCTYGEWTACEGEVTPSAESCNGADDDCNGYADDGNPGAGASCTTTSAGVCAAGVVTCTGGTLVCQQTTSPSTERCNGVDDDCDGVADETCECVDGETRDCYEGAAGTLGVGLCTGGTQTCVEGRWGACEGQVVPADTALASTSFDASTGGWSIDGDGHNLRASGGALVVDDIGDGRIWYFVAPATYNGDLSRLYGASLRWRQLVSHTNLSAESDSVQIFGANGVTMQIGVAAPTTSWTSYVVPVVPGSWTNAANGAVLTEQQIRDVLANVTRFRIRGEYSNTLDTGTIDDVSLVPAAEACDGLDNDCDGVLDDGNPGGGGTCSTGFFGVCSTGTMVCTGAQLVCQMTTGPSAETCDGLDNDCDGVTDPGCDCINGQTRSCYSGAAGTSGVGVCHGGTQTCTTGRWGACTGEVVPTADSCNALDDNCDGRIDEGCLLVESRFDATTEGWTYEGDGTNVRLTTGALTISDAGDGRIWAFIAPAKFTGNFSAAYGGALSYRFRVSARNITGTDAVTITGANGIAMQISTAYPTTTFTTYTIPLVAGSWTNASTGAVLTEAQIRGVLQNITRLRIRGEYANTADVGYLDDVVITSAP